MKKSIFGKSIFGQKAPLAVTNNTPLKIKVELNVENNITYVSNNENTTLALLTQGMFMNSNIDMSNININENETTIFYISKNNEKVKINKLTWFEIYELISKSSAFKNHIVHLLDKYNKDDLQTYYYINSPPQLCLKKN